MVERMFLSGDRFQVTPQLGEPAQPEVPVRAPRAQALVAARQALAVLSTLEEQNEAEARKRERQFRHPQTTELDEIFIRDPRLVEPLRQLRGEGPFPAWGRCGHRLGWIALNPVPEFQGARIVSADYAYPKKDRKPGAFGLKSADKTKTVWSTQTIVEDSSHGRGFQTTPGVGPWGATFGLKRIWRCRVCGKSAPVTNRQLLRRFLETVVDGEKEVQL
jgi:hypothetical protein